MFVPAQWCQRFVLLAVLTLAWPGQGQAQQGCTGDCDGNGGVLITELIRGVNLALGRIGALVCEAYDIDGDGEVEINELIQAVNHALEGCPGVLAVVEEPRHGIVVQAGTVAARVILPAGTDLDSVVATIDGVDVTEELVGFGQVEGTLEDIAAGEHTFLVTALVDGEQKTARSVFEAIALNHPEECEVLNQAECLLPYPSSRFLIADASKPTGFRLNIPARGLPDPNGPPLLPDPINKVDGFNPMVQILMHFPQGVDIEASNAARLLEPGCCGQPDGPPWIQTRTHDDRSLDDDSPSVLIDATTGERVLHWLELDAHAAGNLPRQALVMRPALSLVPGHRYIVAIRNLKAPGGADVVAEPGFAVFRDRRLTNIEPIESRRGAMESMFDQLAGEGVNPEELVLAFDFVVQSEQQLTGAMLAMRDAAYTWLAEVEANDEITFTVTNMQDADCEAPNAVVWRNVSGTFKSPLFLTSDPNQPGVGFLNVDANGVPVQNGFTDANFSVAIPCSSLEQTTPVNHAIVLGHGLFGTGASMTAFVPAVANAVEPWNYIAGATDWRGLAQQDLGWVINDIVGVGETKLNNFGALPDRLKQGMLNTLVLARMMRRGLFNLDTDHFQTPSGNPIFSDREMFYYGISLGGIMGTWLSALTPDVQRFGVDVPSINFACLLQRSTQFGRFQDLLVSTGLTDPMQTILGIGILQELWAAGEPSGYARHITSDPLPGSGGAKRILMTPAWLDKQVSNQCTEIAARTLQVPNLVPASLQRELVGIADREGPLDSAYVMYDTGAFDLFDPAHQEFIPPLANVIPSGVCDPHGDRPRIPHGIRMLLNFLQPDGQVENFCTDVCDAGEPDEIAGGAAEPCDPLE